MTLRVVVVDDQPLARLRLLDLLEEIKDVECVAVASDGDEAIQVIREFCPDVAFLDIHMPGRSGLEVLRSVDPRPLAVFTTAFDRHAVTAFELHALDYLLKPFGADRLRVAVDRARVALGTEAPNDVVERAGPAMTSEAPLTRVFVRRSSQIIPVAIQELDHLEANGDYVTLWEGKRSHLIRVGLADLMARLDPDVFIRVHRSHAVNLNHVKAFATHDRSRLEVVLRNGKRIVASRTRSVRLRERFSI